MEAGNRMNLSTITLAMAVDCQTDLDKKYQRYCPISKRMR